jgi:putative Mg2+ transporter-C (MgtC) family protein
MLNANSFSVQDWITIFIHLSFSALIGALIGRNRRRENKPAGMRTHMLVCLGATIFVMIPFHNPSLISPSQVIQGVAQGIGFLGAGEILQQSDAKNQGEVRIKGLTSAAAIWASASLGIAVGAGFYPIAILGTIFIIFVLEVIHRFEP